MAKQGFGNGAAAALLMFHFSGPGGGKIPSLLFLGWMRVESERGVGEFCGSAIRKLNVKCAARVLKTVVSFSGSPKG